MRDIEMARHLYTDLKSRGFDVWFDDRSVPAGHRLAEEINRGLDWCDIYIPILSSQSLSSPWCQEEINVALTLSNDPGREGRPRIIPVLVEDCQDQMPPMLKGRLYVNFTGRYEEALKELIIKGFQLPAPILKLSKADATQLQSNLQPVTSIKRTRKSGSRLLAFGGGIFAFLVILLMVGAGVFYLRLSPIASIKPTQTPTNIPSWTLANTPTRTPTNTPTPTNTATQQRQGFFIVNRLSGKCIDVWGKPGTENESILQLWDCEFSNPKTDQLWEWYADGFLRNTLSNKCIDAKGRPGDQNETPLQLWNCETLPDPTNDERWYITSDGFIVNILSGKCIDAKGRPGDQNEPPLQIWDCEFGDPTTDQQWELIR